jgi:hypothetical protein
MPHIKRMIILGAIAAATVAWVPAIAGAVPIGSGGGSATIPNSDLVAAQHAAASQSASLDRFSLIHVHTITPATTSVLSANANPQGFQFGDAAIGAGAMAELMSLGTPGAITVRRRVRVRHP